MDSTSLDSLDALYNSMVHESFFEGALLGLILMGIVAGICFVVNAVHRAVGN